MSFRERSVVRIAVTLGAIAGFMGCGPTALNGRRINAGGGHRHEVALGQDQGRQRVPVHAPGVEARRERVPL
jgi:hypothetical protein